jgi:iron complex outermembrane receptor protein/vitamin B12 transporter
MPTFAFLRSCICRVLPVFLAAILLTFSAANCSAASIHGAVTDPSGARIAGATVALVSNGKIIASAVSAGDGSFQIQTGAAGHYFLMISAKSFRQLETPDFYAGQLDAIERNVVLEPEWVHEAIVVTATGTPTPQPQTSEATTVLSSLDLDLRSDLTSALRTVPGTFMVQSGQMGTQSSLFIRGGNSTANKILLDGVSADDIGGYYDFGPLSTTAIERTEVFRGTDSNLYGADAASGVISMTTPHGTTSFPSILFHGDGGNLNTFRDELEVAGTRKKIDYLAAASWLQTSNNLPLDQYHVASIAANLGYQVSGSTLLRGTLHYGVDATGVPGTWDFHHIADDVTEKDQNLFVSASIDNQTTAALHNTVRYGAARKREENNQWTTVGNSNSAYDNYCWGPATFGDTVTIKGANGYSATGQAVLDCTAYEDQFVNNRDQLVYQGDYRFTPHLAALIGFQFEDERGVENFPSDDEKKAIERTNYNYLAAVHGDIKNRFFYTLGGSLEHYSLFGTTTTPHAGVSYYALRPRKGVFSGTRVLFNYGDAVREPTLDNQFSSLYSFLITNGYESVAQQLHIGPVAAPTTRSYEGGIAQNFFSDRLTFRSTYFHNQFGKELESVGGQLLPTLIPDLTAAQQQELENALSYYYTYDHALTVNTQAFRAQGIETTVESGLGKNIFLRGGYTYLDAVVQRSFTSDNEAFMNGEAFTFNGIPLGAYTPLKGARPFRRAPHTGFLSASYAGKNITGIFTAAFASRSDDSTFLLDGDAVADAYGDIGGNSLLLPNRNLDFGYAKLDLGGSYHVLPWMSVYAQAENLTNNQHIAPIGYPSLPFTVRSGIRIAWGLGEGHK